MLAQVSDKVARTLLKVPLVQSFNGSQLRFLAKPDSGLVWEAFKDCLHSVLFQSV